MTRGGQGLFQQVWSSLGLSDFIPSIQPFTIEKAWTHYDYGLGWFYANYNMMLDSLKPLSIGTRKTRGTKRRRSDHVKWLDETVCINHVKLHHFQADCNKEELNSSSVHPKKRRKQISFAPLDNAIANQFYFLEGYNKEDVWYNAADFCEFRAIADDEVIWFMQCTGIFDIRASKAYLYQPHFLG